MYQSLSSYFSIFLTSDDLALDSKFEGLWVSFPTVQILPQSRFRMHSYDWNFEYVSCSSCSRITINIQTSKIGFARELKVARKRLEARQPSLATAAKTDRTTSASLNTSGGSFRMMITGLLNFKGCSKGESWSNLWGRLSAFDEVRKINFYVLWV